MPFTLAHPAVVLPMRRLGLPMAGLVVGSMVPDVPLFAPWFSSYGFTHSLVGVVTLDLADSVLLVLVWTWLLRDALVDLAPDRVRERLVPHAAYTVRQWALVPVAAVLGSLSHVAWDAFTHPGRWGVRHVGWLHQVHGSLRGYQWAQYASGVVGLLVVAGWAWTALARRSAHHRSVRVPSLGPRALVGVVVLTGGCAGVAGLLAAPSGVHAVLYRGAVLGVVGLAAGLLAVGLLWQALVRVPPSA